MPIVLLKRVAFAPRKSPYSSLFSETESLIVSELMPWVLKSKKVLYTRSN